MNRSIWPKHDRILISAFLFVLESHFNFLRIDSVSIRVFIFRLSVSRFHNVYHNSQFPFRLCIVNILICGLRSAAQRKRAETQKKNFLFELKLKSFAGQEQNNEANRIIS